MNRERTRKTNPALLAVACRACAETRRPARPERCLRAPCVVATMKLKAPARS